MRDSTNLCQAIPAVPYCPNRTSATSSFCPEHAAELCALEEREKTAACEAGRLKAIVDRMLSEGTNAYTTAREVMKDEQVVQLYSDSLGRQIDAAVALKTQFLSEGGSCSSSTLSLRVGDLFHSDDEVQLKTVASRVWLR